MSRWKITLEYDGGAFFGWQRQDDAPSIQQSVEEAIKGFSGEDVRLHVAGRTDAGVHALGQAAHFDLAKETDGNRVREALNFYLKGQPISILNAEAVSDEFHARFSAKARHYMYRVINRRPALALDKARAYHVPRALQLEPMQKAAQLLPGEHDFSTFRAAGCQSNGPIKTLDSANIERTGDELRFSFSARSFLYHQVRNMVGSLLQVGLGSWRVDDFEAAFNAADRTQGGPTAPSHALYFMRVDYE